MPAPFDSKPNPTGARRRRHHRRFYGLSNQLQRDVFEAQRNAIDQIFDGLDAYFTAELDAKIEAINDLTDTPEEVDAEFTEEEPDAPVS